MWHSNHTVSLLNKSLIMKIRGFAPFLDILLRFDKNGKLQTDLFVKPTANQSYLNFSSVHPNHIFSGAVISQCPRLHDITHLKRRLSTL